MDAVAEGLEGVVVTRTRMSDVDGERGRLVVGGYPIEALAGQRSFEAVAHLLAEGALPTAAEERAAAGKLAAGRVRAFERRAAWVELARRADGMDALRGCIASDRSEGEGGRAEIDPLVLAGSVAVYAAAYARGLQGAELLAPDPGLGHAADFARMVTGRTDAARAKALDAYLVTVADHGMNASTFTARVVASTGSDLVSAVAAAIGALKGPLHGGAPGPVLDMLDAVGDAARAEEWIARELAEGRRIMGMGHRVYRVRDPRAAVLERALAELEAGGVSTPHLALARSVERAAAELLATKYPTRSLQANVEFYTAVILDAVGLPRTLFSPAFAVGRVAGWCAHVAEQRARGRLIRPASLYDGPLVDGSA